MRVRSDLRTAVRDALCAYPHFEDWTMMTRWAETIDDQALPAVGAFTPRESKRREGSGAYRRDTDLIILIRRTEGADLEDLLDADADIAEELVLGILGQIPYLEDAECVSVDFDIPGSGEQRVGTAVLTFRAVRLASGLGL